MWCLRNFPFYLNSRCLVLYFSCLVVLYWLGSWNVARFLDVDCVSTRVSRVALDRPLFSARLPLSRDEAASFGPIGRFICEGFPDLSLACPVHSNWPRFFTSQHSTSIEINATGKTFVRTVWSTHPNGPWLRFLGLSQRGAPRIFLPDTSTLARARLTWPDCCWIDVVGCCGTAPRFAIGAVSLTFNGARLARQIGAPSPVDLTHTTLPCVPDLSRLVQTCPDLSEPGRTCWPFRFRSRGCLLAAIVLIE